MEKSHSYTAQGFFASAHAFPKVLLVHVSLNLQAELQKLDSKHGPPAVLSTRAHSAGTHMYSSVLQHMVPSLVQPASCGKKPIGQFLMNSELQMLGVKSHSNSNGGGAVAHAEPFLLLVQVWFSAPHAKLQSAFS